MRRRVVTAMLIVSTLLVLVLGGLWLFQRHLIYFPGLALAPPVAHSVPGAYNVEFSTEDGLELRGLYVAPRERAGMVVLVMNGNAGDRHGRAPLARALSREGLGVLLFDYRGYANNPGKPSERGLAKDAEAARRYLVETEHVSPGRLVYLGESLGSAVATGLAVKYPPAGLVLRSPFVDLASVGQKQYPFLPVRLLLKDRYPLAEQLRRVKVPVTVVYGAADSFIPPSQSRRVAEAAPNLRQLVEVAGADHNDPSLLDGPELVAAVADLAKAVAPPST